MIQTKSEAVAALREVLAVLDERGELIEGAAVDSVISYLSGEHGEEPAGD